MRRAATPFKPQDDTGSALLTREEPSRILSNEPPPTGCNESEATTVDSSRCLYELADSITFKWRADSNIDLASDMEELWSCFCDTGMKPQSHQQLIVFLKSILDTSNTAEDSRKHSDATLWNGLPHFKLAVEQKLLQAFLADVSQSRPGWVALNHLLARISLPPASMYDLRMVCLWNLRDVLETSSMAPDLEMLKILMLWLGGHIHWLQLQILRAHSESYPVEDLIPLPIGDLPARMGVALQSTVDHDRLQFWRQRLQESHDLNASDAGMEFYTNAVMSMLQIGIAEVDEWEEMPSANRTKSNA